MQHSAPGGNATRTLSRCVNARRHYTSAKKEGNRRLRRSARNLHRLDLDDATDTFRFVIPTTEWDIS